MSTATTTAVAHAAWCSAHAAPVPERDGTVSEGFCAGRFPVNGTGVVVDVDREPGQPTRVGLYNHSCNSDMTADDARAVAAELLRVADLLDRNPWPVAP